MHGGLTHLVSRDLARSRPVTRDSNLGSVQKHNLTYHFGYVSECFNCAIVLLLCKLIVMYHAIDKQYPFIMPVLSIKRHDSRKLNARRLAAARGGVPCMMPQS